MRKRKTSLRSSATVGGRRDNWTSALAGGPPIEAVLYGYHVIAGVGVDAFQSLSASRGWRAALLGMAACGALCLTETRPALAGPDGCSTTGTTVTCTGDQSAGIGPADFDQTAVDTLDVNSLTTGIAPASGVSGIYFDRVTGGITISSDVSTHSITVTGAADGIHASTDGVVTINHAGDISSAGGFGIFTSSVGGFFNSTDTTITSSGTIDAYANGIHAYTDAGFSGDIDITHSGDINASIGSGIYAESNYFGVSITNVGNITANNSGIFAYGIHSVAIDSTGTIAATIGILGISSLNDVTILHSGDIASDLTGIEAEADSVTIEQHDGTIVSSNGNAIFASAAASINITNGSDLIAHDFGIVASAGGDITLDNTGDISSSTASGMFLAAQSAISVTNSGDILAPGYGIHASMSNVFGSDVTVDSTGDIASSGSEGIHASSVAGNTSVTSRGSIGAHGDGIRASAPFSATVSSIGDVASITGSAIHASAGGNADVTVNGGALSGGHAGINLDGGGTGTVTIGSAATVTGGLYAILSGAGDDMVNNSGMVTGNVDLGGGMNAFDNLSGSVFNSGMTLGLGAGNMLNNSGTLAPLGAGVIGTTTLTGNFVQNAGGTFRVDVDDTGASDRLVADTVTFNGGLVDVIALPGSYANSTDYTIIQSASGLTGDFDSTAVSDTLAFLTPALSEQADDLVMTLTRRLAPPVGGGSGGGLFSSVADTGNQFATANAVETLGGGNPIYDHIMVLTEVQARNAFDTLSGETYASQQGAFIQQGQAMQTALLNRGMRGSNAASGEGAVMSFLDTGENGGHPVGAGDGSIWGAAYGGHAWLDGDGATAGGRSLSGGFQAGADDWFGDFRLGLMLAAGRTQFTVPSLRSVTNSTDYGLGIYGGTEIGATNIALGASYVRHDIDNTRTVAFPGILETLNADYSGGTGQVFGEIGHRLEIGNVDIRPFGQVALIYNHTGGFSESGGASALTVASSEQSNLFTTIGVRGSAQFVLRNDMTLAIRGGLGWRHGFGGASSTLNAFGNGASFTVAGAPLTRDAVMLEAGVDLDIKDSARLSLSYEGQFGGHAQDHGVSAAFKLGF